MLKRRVGVLGATGAVGQRVVQHLDNHPWFDVVSVMASPASAGRPYQESAAWVLPTPAPPGVRTMIVQSCDPTQHPDPAGLDLVFSALPHAAAQCVEHAWAGAGVAVFSNARTHRMAADVPLVIPEVNADHLHLLEVQREARGWTGRGGIVTNANCSSTFLTMVLAPLHAAFGVEQVSVTTLQAMSGAGLGLPALAIHGNVIPHISGEEEKLETEPLKMLGARTPEGIKPAAFPISAQVHRVPVVDGHTEALSLRLRGNPEPDDVRAVLTESTGIPQELELPSAPERPIVVCDGPDRPQPALDLGIQAGMATLVGRIRRCPVLGIKLVLLGHNTIRGAGAGSVLNAELACTWGLA